jgi:hypothetical protein
MLMPPRAPRTSHHFRHELESPFVPERRAALKAWAEAGGYRAILSRTAERRPELLIDVVVIEAYGLANEGRTVDPYVIVFGGSRQVLRTATRTEVR